MKTLKEYYIELLKIINSDLTESKRDRKIIDFLGEMKSECIEHGINVMHKSAIKTIKK